MRLQEGIVVDKEMTFGGLKFSALRREVFFENEDGTPTTEVKERTYDLKSSAQGKMIQVSIPGDNPLKEFAYNAEVDILKPKLNTVATPSFRGAEVEWYMKADDIVLKGTKDNAGQPGGEKASGGQTQEQKTPDGQPQEQKAGGSKK